MNAFATADYLHDILFLARCATSIKRKKELLLFAVIKVLHALVDGKVHTRARDKNKKSARVCAYIKRQNTIAIILTVEAWSEN